jgi:hypothetical protein
MANQLAALVPNMTATQGDVLKRLAALHALQSHGSLLTVNSTNHSTMKSSRISKQNSLSHSKRC